MVTGTPPRLWLSLATALAIVGGLWEPIAGAARALRQPPPGLDAGQEADRFYAGARDVLPPRVGFCSDVDPREALAMPPSDRTNARVAYRFLAQYAVAPVLLVPVLGQPSNGQREPSPAESAERLSRLDRVLVSAPSGSSCWEQARAAGFRPVSQAGAAVLFARSR